MNPGRITAIIVSIATCLATATHAASGSWNSNTDGNWSDSSKWLNGIIADGQGSTGNLTFNITPNRTITIDSTSRTLGILNIGDTNATNSYTVASSGGAVLIMDNGGSPAQINQLSTSAANIISSGITLNDDLEINNASSLGLTLSGNITGNAVEIALNSTGTGAVTLSGVNTFSGAVRVNTGTLTVASAAGGNTAVAALNASNTLYLNAGATFSRGDGGSSSNLFTIAGINDGTGGGGLYTRGTGGGTRWTELAGDDDYSFSGVIQNGSGTSYIGMVKTGAGTQTLSGANTYTGGTMLGGGTLRLNGGTGSLAATGVLTMQGAKFWYDNTSAAGTKAQSLGALTFSKGDNIVQSTKGAATSSSLTFSSLAARTTGATANFVYADGTAGADNSINLTGASAGFVNQGVFVNGANYGYMNASGTYIRAAVYGSDAGFVNASGALTAASHNLVTSSITNQGAIIVNTIKFDGAGTVDLDIADGAIVSFANGGLLRAGGGSTTISGGTIRGNTSVEMVVRTDSASDRLTINSVIGASGSNALTKTGEGTLTLGGINSYTGVTYVNGGTLSVSANANLGAQATGASVNLNNGTLRATSSFGLNNGGAGTNDRGVVLTNTGTIDVTSSNTLTVSGVVSDTYAATSTTAQRGSLTKSGSGTLVLGNTNTYTGDTAVSAGTLVISGSLANTRAIDVALGATLKVDGSTNASASVSVAGTLGGTGVVGGATTITGVLSPGNSEGLISFSNALTLSGNSALTSLEIAGTSRGVLGGYDAVNIGASQLLTYDGVLRLTMTAAIASATYNLFDFTAGYDLGGFDSLAFAGGFYSGAWAETSAGSGVWKSLSGGQDFTFTEATGDLVVAAVPEPGAWALVGLGLAFLMVFRRRAVRE
ncbi:MAG: autotransporter-associated beta strand repeat-containing protein [Verrucomicrobia bacterium]|nr:autotransporter-associated beta strand repeat-containing protein [Verrucomicrobiota bacterium]